MKVTPDRLAVAEAVWGAAKEFFAAPDTAPIVDLDAVIEALPEPEPVQPADKLAGNSDVQAWDIEAPGAQMMPQTIQEVEDLIDAAVAREREECAAEVEAQIPYFDRVLEASTTIALNAAARKIRARSGKGE